MRTETGQLVILHFTPDEVEVHEVRPARQQAAKASAGGLLLAVGLALIATTAADRGPAWLDVALWAVCGAVFAVGAVGGLAWWLVTIARDRGLGPVRTIAPASVLSAASRADNGEVTVTLHEADGHDRTFSAVGHSGALLANQFARLLTPA